MEANQTAGVATWLKFRMVPELMFSSALPDPRAQRDRMDYQGLMVYLEWQEETAILDYQTAPPVVRDALLVQQEHLVSQDTRDLAVHVDLREKRDRSVRLVAMEALVTEE